MDGFIKRSPGEDVTLETRHDSHEAVDKQKRYRQILGILDGREMTAKEIANEMYLKWMIPTNERNYSAPRLTEMAEKGMVEVVGKKLCQWTGKTVAVYAIRKP